MLVGVMNEHQLLHLNIDGAVRMRPELLQVVVLVPRFKHLAVSGRVRLRQSDGDTRREKQLDASAGRPEDVHDVRCPDIRGLRVSGCVPRLGLLLIAKVDSIVGLANVEH